VIDLIEHRNADTPFFLYLAYHAPHTPLSPPPTSMELYKDIKSGSQKLLYANITFMDTQIGRLVNVLKARGKLEDTLYLFIMTMEEFQDQVPAIYRFALKKGRYTKAEFGLEHLRGGPNCCLRQLSVTSLCV